MSYIEISKPRPHVSVVTLNRPERMNARSFDTVQPLHDAILEVGAELVRMTTNNLDEAIRARKEGRKPNYTD